MSKKLTKWEISVIRSTAKNCNRFVKSKQKLETKIAELLNEMEAIDKTIEGFEAPIREITGGYASYDIFKTVTVDDKTTFELIYPETILPPTKEDGENSEKEQAVSVPEESSPVEETTEEAQMPEKENSELTEEEDDTMNEAFMERMSEEEENRDFNFEEEDRF